VWRSVYHTRAHTHTHTHTGGGEGVKTTRGSAAIHSKGRIACRVTVWVHDTARMLFRTHGNNETHASVASSSEVVNAAV
jgi:hypothetical protein